MILILPDFFPEVINWLLEEKLLGGSDTRCISLLVNTFICTFYIESFKLWNNPYICNLFFAINFNFESIIFNLEIIALIYLHFYMYIFCRNVCTVRWLLQWMLSGHWAVKPIVSWFKWSPKSICNPIQIVHFKKIWPVYKVLTPNEEGSV